MSCEIKQMHRLCIFNFDNFYAALSVSLNPTFLASESLSFEIILINRRALKSLAGVRISRPEP